MAPARALPMSGCPTPGPGAPAHGRRAGLARFWRPADRGMGVGLVDQQVHRDCVGGDGRSRPRPREARGPARSTNSRRPPEPLRAAYACFKPRCESLGGHGVRSCSGRSPSVTAFHSGTGGRRLATSFLRPGWPHARGHRRDRPHAPPNAESPLDRAGSAVDLRPIPLRLEAPLPRWPLLMRRAVALHTRPPRPQPQA